MPAASGVSGALGASAALVAVIALSLGLFFAVRYAAGQADEDISPAPDLNDGIALLRLLDKFPRIIQGRKRLVRRP